MLRGDKNKNWMKECGVVLVFTAEAGGQAMLVIRGWVILPPAGEM